MDRQQLTQRALEVQRAMDKEVYPSEVDRREAWVKKTVTLCNENTDSAEREEEIRAVIDELSRLGRVNEGSSDSSSVESTNTIDRSPSKPKISGWMWIAGAIVALPLIVPLVRITEAIMMVLLRGIL